MTEPLNPVDIEQHILNVSNRIGNGIRIVSERREAYLQAERDFKKAYAIAHAEHDGPQTAKTQAAVLATLEEKEARDDAYAAFKYAQDLAHGLGQELMAWQSVGRSVGNMYAVAGRGER